MRANEVEYWATVGNLREVQRAVASGHDVNAVAEDGYTALHGAAENNHTEIVIFLIKCGADQNAKDSFGSTPLDLAMAAGHAEVATILRQASGN